MPKTKTDEHRRKAKKMKRITALPLHLNSGLMANHYFDFTKASILSSAIFLNFHEIYYILKISNKLVKDLSFLHLLPLASGTCSFNFFLRVLIYLFIYFVFVLFIYYISFNFFFTLLLEGEECFRQEKKCR